MSTMLLYLLAGMGQFAGQASDDPRASDQRSDGQASLARMTADLGQFEVSLGSDASRKLSLRTEPVLRWNYPIRNLDDGALFVWLDEDRPEAIAAVMSYRDARQNPRRAFEFLSLSQGQLSATKGGDRWWHAQKAGFTWQTIPEAPPPAVTAARRRRQMRELAARFKVSVESDKNRYELRLLSQPLYRYQNAEADILDGSLFALAEGTDPELILGLESAADQPGWKYAVGRMTRWAIEVRYRDKVVRQFQQLLGRIEPTETYHIADAGPLEARP